MSDKKWNWVEAIATDDLPEGRVASVTCGHKRVCMTHHEGEFAALDDRCPHQGGPLGEGSIENGMLRCPWHGWDFYPTTGKPPGGFDDGVDTFPVKVEDGKVYVALDQEDEHTRTVSDVMAETLTAWGVRHCWGMVGHSNLGLADALRREAEAGRLSYYGIRHEGAASFAASAYGKLTGRPGICFVTRGPGATNAAVGVHIADQDSTPMILFIGQVARDMADREAFQEVDFRQMFTPLAKWVAQIEAPERIPEYVSRAFHVATSGRPGPVVLALPEDMLTARAAVADAGPAHLVEAQAGSAEFEGIRSALDKAERPLVLIGGGGWSATAAADLAGFAQHFDLPVAVTFRCQDYFDNLSDHYAGHVGIGINPKLKKRIADADLILAIGTRLGEMTTGGYAMFSVPEPAQKLIHIYPGSDELGRVYRPVLAINAASGPACAALRALKAPRSVPWSAWRAAAHSDYLDHIVPVRTPGAARLEDIIVHLRETLDDTAIVTNGAGNYCGWVNRYYPYRGYRTQLGPTSGSMGYGLPGAIAAKLQHPERTVVAFAGDGCFLMTGQELATAVQYDLAIIIIVCNNGMYGTIRMHQEREHPGRVNATALANPDFAALARSFGAHGERVETSEAFAGAFARAVAAGKPALIEILTDPEALAPELTLSAARKLKS